MQEVYAALLLHEGQKPIDEGSIKKVLESAGIKPDESRIKALVSSLEGQNIDELIKQAVVAVTAPVAEEKKEEKKKEEKPKEAAEGLSALFG